MNSVASELFIVFVISLLSLSGPINAMKKSAQNHRRSNPNKPLNRQTILFPEENWTQPDIGDPSDSNADLTFAESVIDPFPGGQRHNELFRNGTLIKCMRSGSTFCENEFPVEYRIESIEKSLEKAVKTNSIFVSEILSGTDRGDRTLSASGRFGDESRSFCETKVTTIYPRWGLDIDGDWRSILNQDHFRQPVKVRLCVAAKGKRGNAMTYLGELVKLPRGYRRDARKHIRTTSC